MSLKTFWETGEARNALAWVEIAIYWSHSVQLSSKVDTGITHLKRALRSIHILLISSQGMFYLLHYVKRRTSKWVPSGCQDRHELDMVRRETAE